jgi:hypothetical protein
VTLTRRTIISSVSPVAKSLAWARSHGWPIVGLKTGHVAMVTAPAEVARELMRLAA